MKLQEKREEASFSLRQIVSPLEKHVDRHSVFYMQAPFVILFILFIIIPVIIAIALSFTDFNSIEKPNFVGLENYINMCYKYLMYEPFTTKTTRKIKGE